MFHTIKDEMIYSDVRERTVSVIASCFCENVTAFFVYFFKAVIFFSRPDIAKSFPGLYTGHASLNTRKFKCCVTLIS